MQQDSKQWYAVYTKPKWEKKVAHQLSERGFENYCPLNRVQKQWSDRKKIVLEPLFSSYVFVRSTEAGHLPVKKVSGVLNFVYWLRKPAVIREEEIDVIRQFMNEHVNVRLERCDVNLDDKVRIIGGPLMYREGNILEVKNKTVRVMLPSLGYCLVAEVAKSNIEIIRELEPSLKKMTS